MKKVFLHISEEFEYTWIGKDNGMIPMYMSLLYGYDSKILTVNLKNDLPDKENELTFIKVKRVFSYLGNFAYFIKILKRLNIFKYLIKNAKNIDVLMLFHISRCSYWYAYLYKMFNPKGFIYVKADFNLKVYQKELEVVEKPAKSLKMFFRKIRETKEYKKRKKLIPIINLISYESLISYENMKNEYAGINTAEKTIYLPNGYDDIYIQKNFKIRKFEEKENIILTVGRLGTPEKNTQFLIEGIKDINLDNWKVFFVGSMTNDLENYVQQFFIENPSLKDKIIFTGEIKDRKVLYEYYNRAKVFVLPSKWESFGIVMVEAMAFGNYIITSNTSAALDITNNNKIGKIIDISSKYDLTNSINDVIENKIDLKSKYSDTLEYVKKFKYSSLIKRLNERIKI